MKMPSPTLRSAAGWIVILVLHAILLPRMDGGDVVHRWLAGGNDAAPVDLALIGLFLVVRLMAVVVLPGLVGLRLALLAADAAGRRFGRARDGKSPATGAS